MKDTPSRVRAPRKGAALLLACALLVSLLASGCVGAPAARESRAPPEEGATIRVAMFPWSTSLVWLLTIHQNGTRSYPEAIVKFSVEKRGGVPVGNEQTTTSLSPENETHVRITTKNLGYGDYLYHVVVENGSGRILGETEGLAENCVC